MKNHPFIEVTDVLTDNVISINFNYIKKLNSVSYTDTDGIEKQFTKIVLDGNDIVEVVETDSSIKNQINALIRSNRHTPSAVCVVE